MKLKLINVTYCVFLLVVLIFVSVPAIIVVTEIKKKNAPKWPATNTLELSIDAEIYKQYNYSNFYRVKNLLVEIDSQLKQRGCSNTAMKLDYDLYTFTIQQDGRVKVFYRQP